MFKLLIVTWLFSQVNCLNEILRGQSVLYGLSSIIAKTENSSLCEQQLQLLFEAVNDHQVWSLKALDASGGPGVGFIYGNNLWIGSYAQCSDISNINKFEVDYERIKHPNATPYDYPPYPMDFYMFYMQHNNTLQYHHQLPLEFTVQLGLCLPKSCSPQDLTEQFNKYLKAKYLYIQNLYELNLSLTEIKPIEQQYFWMLKLPKTIILLSITGTILLLTVIGTVYDVRRHNKAKNLITGLSNNISDKCKVSEIQLVESCEEEDSNIFGEIVKCFSFYSNVKNLMKTKLAGDSVATIHGLRFITMMWVIEVHSVYYAVDFIDNPATVFRLSETIFSQILSNSTYCVDTYLFISGFLVAYLYLKDKPATSLTEQHSVNYVKKIMEFFIMVFNRLFRLTPPYIIIILVTNTLYTYYQKASPLMISERADILCSEYWWRNILYINNLYPRSEMCLSWSWYVGADTQFYIITSFLLILSTIAFKISATIIILILLATVPITAYSSYNIGYIPTMDNQLKFLDNIYDLPWNRFGPYLIGVITAYILLVKMKKTLILRKKIKILLWMLFPLLNLWILFGIYGRNISIEFSAFYMATSRTLWGVGIAWLLVACCTGNARALEKFLSFRGFIPLSRLTYCAYLLNPLVSTMVYVDSQSSLRSSIANIALNGNAICFITFLIAFLFSTLFETPFILLSKLMMKKRHVKPKSNQVENGNV